MHQTTLDQMRTMRLHGMAKMYEAILTMPEHQHPEGHELVAHLVQCELESKHSKRTQLLLHNAKLRNPAYLEGIRLGTERNLSKTQIAQLAQCQWINSRTNILITGATGCGKSYLSCTLGHQACLEGYKTLYRNMNRFVGRITLAKADGSYIKLLNQMEKTHVLVLNDFGLQPMTADIKLTLLNMMEDRYDREALIMASQLPSSAWYEYLDNQTLADSIMDRLIAKSIRIELKENRNVLQSNFHLIT